MYQHLEYTDPKLVPLEVGRNDSGDVVVDIGRVTTFMTLLQFNELRAEINKFDVGGLP
jgi:hypothetical protein